MIDLTRETDLIKRISVERGSTTMLKSCVIVAIAIITTVIASVPRSSQNAATDDEAAYYGTAVIKGAVTILNHPILGKTPGNSIFLVFQRSNCQQCVIGTWTDIDGNFQIHVSPGQYKLIVRDGKREKETRDVLAPSQQRYIDAGKPGTTANYNIEIIVPKD